MKIRFDDIDSTAVHTLNCNGGIPEQIEIYGIPKDLADRLRKADLENVIVNPEGTKRYLEFSFRRLLTDDVEGTLRIEIRFVARGFVCFELKRSVFSIVLDTKVLKLRMNCTDTGRNYTEAMLSVDLGNTRTCALVCPNIHSGNFVMKRLKLSPHYGYSNEGGDGKGGISPSNGVWDSVCVIGKSKVYDKLSPSFIRLGADNDFYLRDGKVFSANRRSLSTPKRYFWDADENQRWCVIHPGDSEEYLLEHQNDIELANHIANTTYRGVRPRAMILEGMIFEMLEQAERMLNNGERYLPNAERSGDSESPSSYSFVTHLVMTYPAAWSKDEINKYREVIQRGIDCYVSQRCRNIPIQLHMDCNEATAVIVNYIHGESSRCGDGTTWLELVGRPKKFRDTGRSLRIGVIDIGGGTSDLAIAEVELSPMLNAPQISTLYTTGTNEAGDKLIEKIINKIIFEKIFDILVKRDLAGDRREKLKAFLGKKVVPRLKSLTRSFWFPLAVEFLESVKSDDAGSGFEITVYDPNDDRHLLSRGFESFRRAFVEDSAAAEDAEIRNLSFFIDELPGAESDNQDEEQKNPPAALKIAFDAKDQETFRTLLLDNFRYSPQIFGSAISAYQCDLMIWSGKTADNPSIRKLFEDYMPVPPEALVSMNNYRIGSSDFPLTDLKGRLSDSKLATAIGAALYTHQQLGGRGGLRMTICNRNTDCRFFWGTVNRNGIFQPLFRGNAMKSEILSYNGIQRVVIYRATSDSVMACPIPAYEFRPKPERNIDNINNIQFELVEIDGQLDFVPWGGDYRQNGEQKVFAANTKNDFELRIRMTDEDEIWIDSGKII